MTRAIYTLGMDTTSGSKEIQQPGDTVIHNSGTPTLVLGSSSIIGTGATFTITGNNECGIITLTIGASLLTPGGTAMTMTFANGLTFPNQAIVLITANNTNYASILTSIAVNCPSTSTAVLTLAAGITLGLGKSYSGYYQIKGW